MQLTKQQEVAKKVSDDKFNSTLGSLIDFM